MDILLIIALNVAAIVFFILELFIFPGMTLSAIAGLGCMGYSIYYAFVHLGTTAGYITTISSGIIALIAIYYFIRWKKIDKYSLKENIDSTIDRSAERSIKVGDKGISTTRLALYGRAMINGQDIEVKSANGFIDEKIPIEVVAVKTAEVSVRKATV
ncbi:hypothetical protein Bcop_2282 [Bacteroides coprosuis DSM 18011]|uniref:Uncharacterized protein n=1 Tax=Bacteroides coprosuis DSM 18011 TaxID=679937 RepID=F3ZUY2_9BACE|nr:MULTISPECIES: NfeD family protein [Bacteroides]EGJ72440.1 hypothetical protein Bcop_2282 [Bacteroides coprosuis DSM 18011]